MIGMNIQAQERAMEHFAGTGFLRGPASAVPAVFAHLLSGVFVSGFFGLLGTGFSSIGLTGGDICFVEVEGDWLRFGTFRVTLELGRERTESSSDPDPCSDPGTEPTDFRRSISELP